jgi:hypothetical protein
MSGVRFSGGGYTPPGAVINAIHNHAVKAFTRPDRWEKTANGLLEKAHGKSLLWNQLRARALQFANLWTRYDYHTFSPVKLGPLQFKVAAPPLGALMLLLLPCTVGPRVDRAYQRGKKNNDCREVGDIIRRDIPSILFLIFALEAVGRRMCKLVSKSQNIQLLNPEGSHVLNYSQLRNYRIDSPKALEAIIAEKNGKALVKAVHGLDDRGLAKLTGDTRLANCLNDLKKNVETLVNDVDQHGLKGDEATKRYAAVFKKFEHAENARKELLNHVMKSGSSESLRAARDLQGEFTGVLEKFAKRWRLPSDILSFGIVLFLIGWLPVWLNSIWNKYRFHKEEAEEAKRQQSQTSAPLNPQLTFQALRSSSRLAPNYFRR